MKFMEYFLILLRKYYVVNHIPKLLTYSFGIVMWEMTSGIPAFNNLPHDFNLSLNICQGLRPEIVEGKVPKIFDDTEKQNIFEETEVKYTELIKKCWDSDPDKRPTTEELYENFNKWN